MRTKTLALSAVLGMLGSASLLAQNNVYSINAVGYINVTLPPGYSIITCPLICGTDPAHPTLTNDVNVLFPNASAYSYATIQAFNNGGTFGNDDVSQFGSWQNGGDTFTLLPGAAAFFLNPSANNMTATFVGTVPQGSLTNTLYAGYNLVGSMVPTSGDLTQNTIMNGGSATGFGPTGPGQYDSILFYDSASNGHGGQIGYAGTGDSVEFSFGSWSGGTGLNGAPAFTGVTTGFFYFNANSKYNWVESFTISQ
jgi:hypothetical protein